MKKIISILVMACMITGCAGLKPDELVKTDIPDTTINTVSTSTGSWQSFISQYWFAAAVSVVCIASLACNCWQYRKERGRVAVKREPALKFTESQGSIDIPATVSIQEITAERDRLAADIERQTQEITQLVRTYDEKLAEIKEQFITEQTRYTQEFESLTQQKQQHEQHLKEIEERTTIRLNNLLERTQQQYDRFKKLNEQQKEQIDKLTADKEKAEKSYKELRASCHFFMDGCELISPVATRHEASTAELIKVIKKQTEEAKSRDKAIEQLKRQLKEQRNQIIQLEARLKEQAEQAKPE
jgi:DNA repair exonuclease SbcCD ATPase subunit